MDVQETQVQTDRVATVPNALSLLRLLGVPVFLWLILGPKADGLAVLLLVGAAFLVRNVFFAPTKITAYFPSATGIYAGDEVRISGVKVGKINSIDPDGTQAKITMSIDRDVPIPADAMPEISPDQLAP